ncbi:hypothetical protein [Streptococcus saliviloxodontae]|uniref:DNA-3-methyladenine glycosylase II n=1 Tax=Streptococcus saliviloxodontae TaxID=1349416 RepID=A0ABS2PME5_9STRE|nr:hypothetical protein [Streptococcus saliviloxodontae]MBM7636271.1 DNA-3-methyladenine glycosylase II [Streptococcus saliviloxodontae]
MYQFEEIISPKSPFNFDIMLEVTQMFYPTQDSFRKINGSLVYGYNLDDQLVIISLKPLEEENSLLRLRFLSEKELTQEQIKLLKTAVYRRFSLDMDLDIFYNLMANDPVMEPVLSYLNGYHPVSFSSLEETVLWALISQRTPMPLARKQKHSVMELASHHLHIKDLDFIGFPSLQQLVAISHEDWMTTIGIEKKVTYIQSFIQAMCQRQTDFFSDDYDHQYRFLKDCYGIGDWTAEFAIVRSGANFSKVPWSEKANRDTFTKYYGPTASRENLEAHYGNYAGLWIHYLRIYDYLTRIH